MRFLPRNWKDVMALAVLVGLPVWWVLFQPVEILVGTTGAGWTLVVQFYWRKAGTDGGVDK